MEVEEVEEQAEKPMRRTGGGGGPEGRNGGTKEAKGGRVGELEREERSRELAEDINNGLVTHVRWYTLLENYLRYRIMQRKKSGRAAAWW